jgi:hypothetical protein
MYEVLLEGIVSAIKNIKQQNYKQAKDILIKSKEESEVIFLELVNRELKIHHIDRGRQTVSKPLEKYRKMWYIFNIISQQN